MKKKSAFWERFAQRYGVDEKTMMQANYNKFVDEVKKEEPAEDDSSTFWKRFSLRYGVRRNEE